MESPGHDPGVMSQEPDEMLTWESFMRSDGPVSQTHQCRPQEDQYKLKSATALPLWSTTHSYDTVFSFSPSHLFSVTMYQTLF